jgi:hypothetical protein
MKVQQELPFITDAIQEKRMIYDSFLNSYDFVKRECLKCGSKENLHNVFIEQDKRKKDCDYDYNFMLCSNCSGRNDSYLLKMI